MEYFVHCDDDDYCRPACCPQLEFSFPDRRDLLVLGPLPVRVRTVFLAKLFALTGVLSFSIISLNCFIGMVRPLFFSNPGTGLLGGIRAIGAYWATITAAATFIFFVFFATGCGGLMLPWLLVLRRRRCSRFAHSPFCLAATYWNRLLEVFRH